MPVSREQLQVLAAERQLQAATLERVIRLLDVLAAFAADTEIAPRIALKGGTALNLFHFDVDRLSVDIDLNYVGALSRSEMETDRPRLEKRIETLMGSMGYTPRREPTEHAGGKWSYRFASILGGAASIEIDINYLYRAPLFGVLRMPSASVGAYQAKNVPVLDIHEIVAGKLVALVTRQTARDLFDAHRIIAMQGLDWAKVKVAMLMIGASASVFDWRTASVERIGCDPEDTQKLVMCLHTRYFDRFGGPVEWIKRAVADCQAALEPLFAFAANERAFLDRVLNDGIINASQLEAPEHIRAAIEACPALQWKAQNVRAWKGSPRARTASARKKS